MRPASVPAILFRTPRRASAARNASTRWRTKSGRLSGDSRNAFRTRGIHSARAECIPVARKACGEVPEGAAVIGKISTPRGEHVEPLIYYLYSPGRREEHTDPHIIAGWRHPAELEPPLREDGRRDFRRLTGLLNQPHAAMGTWGFARPVWHCSVPLKTRCCPTTNGRRSPAMSCTLPLRPRPAGGAHRPAHHRRLAAPGRR